MQADIDRSYNTAPSVEVHGEPGRGVHRPQVPLLFQQPVVCTSVTFSESAMLKIPANASTTHFLTMSSHAKMPSLPLFNVALHPLVTVGSHA